MPATKCHESLPLSLVQSVQLHLPRAEIGLEIGSMRKRQDSLSSLVVDLLSLKIDLAVVLCMQSIRGHKRVWWKEPGVLGQLEVFEFDVGGKL